MISKIGSGLAVLIALTTIALAADSVFTVDQQLAARQLGEVTGEGLFCGQVDIALPLKQIVVSAADARGMDQDQRAELGALYAQARDAGFEVFSEGAQCVGEDAFANKARLATVEFLYAFGQ